MFDDRSAITDGVGPARLAEAAGRATVDSVQGRLAGVLRHVLAQLQLERQLRDPPVQPPHRTPYEDQSDEADNVTVDC